MATIDKLDISVYNLYAVRTKMVEQINQQYRLGEASSIPPQINIVDIYPRLTELDLLLGIVPTHNPWAYFFPPPKFRHLRRSPFAFHRIVPSMGTLDDQEEDEVKLLSVEVRSSEEEKEKQTIYACFKEIEKINSWLSFIVGRIGQFLQG